MPGPIASLQVNLGFDAGDFARGVADAQGAFSRFAHEIGNQFQNLERVIRRVGIGLTAGITAPFGLLVHTSRRTAASFEAAMNRVEAALRGISSDQFERLSEAARNLGPEVGLSAVQAAEGIETLALTGMSAESILRGGLGSTLRLSAANLGEVADSAALVSDVMRQFTLTTQDLPRVVDLVTGALDASKLSFQDYQLAVSQAGGAAGAAGVEFEDFNAALAATAPLFQSGSDAGTSFKTFITSLTPQSEDATRVMRQLGLQFFDATGRMKSMADIAQELRDSLAGLSERSRTEALRTMFGTDAMRTAIGLMQQGRDGILGLQEAISQTDAGEKLAIQLRGAEAASNRLAAAFERVKIALGSAGILQAFTGVTIALTAVANAFAGLPPAIHTVIIVIAGMAAAIGPLMLAIVGIGRLALPLFIGRLGLLGTALVAIINPIGALAALFVRLAVALTGATSALSLFATGLARVLGALGLAITAFTLLYFGLGRTTEANSRLRQSAEEARSALANQEEQTLLLATATGEARRALIAKMQADRAAAVQALRTAMAELQAARATLIRARATATLNRERMRVAANDPRLMVGAGPEIGRQLNAQADADFRESVDTVRTLTRAVEGFNTTLASATAGAAADVDFSRPPRERRRRDTSDRDREEALRNEHQYQSDLRRFQIEHLRAQQEQITDLGTRLQLDNEILDIERQQYAADLTLAVQLKDLTAARAEQLMIAYDRVDEERRHTLTLRQRRQIDEENRRIDQAAFDIAAEALQQESQLAETSAERRDVEMRLLELAYRHERARLMAIEADEAAGRDAVIEARLRREALDAWFVREREILNMRTQGPLESFLTQLPTTAAKANEALQRVAAEGLRAIEDALVGLLSGTKSLAAAFRDMATSIIADLLRIQIQRMITIPLANMLGSAFGASGGGAASSALGSISSMFNSGGPRGFDSGGRIRVAGAPGIDRNLLSLNGMPVARVSRGEEINVGRGSSGNTFNIYSTAPNSGDPRRDRRSSMQHAAIMRDEIARASKAGY